MIYSSTDNWLNIQFSLFCFSRPIDISASNMQVHAICRPMLSNRRHVRKLQGTTDTKRERDLAASWLDKVKTMPPMGMHRGGATVRKKRDVVIFTKRYIKA